ncbi:hypothetical protein BDV23DRAFT_161782 [Aspergillus alliaceus]|uniref:Secreted protein n=1 Tax=Petromyces alliaceus TaxID=209559 RepID=A0A5N7BZ50_PETAA|nr:hypothetical protein BDV23DRAFT_161782 [Aspergillus alliaceus]
MLHRGAATETLAVFSSSLLIFLSPFQEEPVGFFDMFYSFFLASGGSEGDHGEGCSLWFEETFPIFLGRHHLIHLYQ